MIKQRWSTVTIVRIILVFANVAIPRLSYEDVSMTGILGLLAR